MSIYPRIQQRYKRRPLLLVLKTI